MKKDVFRVFTLMFVVLAFAFFTIACPTPEPEVEKFSVSVEAGEFGSVSVSPEIPEDGKFEKGTELTITATADENYKVDSWTITGSSVTSGGEKGDTTAVVVVNSNLNVEVFFTLSQKSFSVGEVSFLMKKIDEVENTTLGDNGQSNNLEHTVTLSEYWIGETEVTQELWEEVMGSNPSYSQGDSHLPDPGEVQEKRPVENINWFDCIAFCNKLTKKVYGEDTEECLYYDSGDNSVYTVEDATAEKVPSFEINSTKKGFRLPTEAEWEYAAKGGEDYTYSGSDDINAVAWWGNSSGNSNSKTHQVKKLAANGYGLYDMSGNVWEWCFDSCVEIFQPASGDNPVGSSGSARVRRGGAFGDDSNSCVLAFRRDRGASSYFNGLGLRLVARF
ncbi:MAG: hypothetical protein CR988_08375 [Treponema sp.]|nr:MAG: hypothetical protein CR988_08375 [Treponema sp.]